MNLTKIAAGAACGTVMLCLSLMIWAKDPDLLLHEETVSLLLQREGVADERALETCYPELITIRADMGRMAELNRILANQTRSPAPQISTGEARHLRQRQNELIRLRRGVRTALVQLVAAYETFQP
ncbi:MAG: hypothetical protein AAFN92_00915 [Bacteroidota bacterium]